MISKKHLESEGSDALVVRVLFVVSQGVATMKTLARIDSISVTEDEFLLQVSIVLSVGAQVPRQCFGASKTGLNKGTMGWGSTNPLYPLGEALENGH